MSVQTTPNGSQLNLSETLEMAKLYCDRGDYDLALPKLNLCAHAAIEAKDFTTYLKAIQLILRIHAEREEYEQLSALKERLHDMVIREGFELNSRVYYVFGIAALYKNQVDTALEYFKISLEHALKTNLKEDICYSILGIANCYRHQAKFEEALKEIYNLNIFLEFIDNTDLKTGVLSSNALVLLDMKRHQQALDILWQAYEMTKYSKNISTSLGILMNIGVTLYEMGEKDAAKVYFDLIKKTINPKNSSRNLKTLEKYSELLENKSPNTYDLAIDLENHSVTEKNLGRIDFKNQFILLDLLRLFISRQGEVFSKEYLVENIWKQQYEPDVHDNKIYVTIKRLRKMIEPDYDHPKYIFRSKNGYFLNKSIKITGPVSVEREGSRL